MKKLQLTTASGTSEILIGEHLSSRLIGLEQEPVLIIDEQVNYHHQNIFEPFRSAIVPPGESHKTLQTVEKLYRDLIALEADRGTLVVGVGGGLATDVAGFVASTFLRGTPFGFISTTLLGQVDASIGGKNGVNLDGYKNMVGCIRQPNFVWCDLSLLGSLDNREYVSGIAELIKYGLIRDYSFMEYVEEHLDGILKKEPDVLEHVVSTSAGIKTEVVQKDENETDLRRILNFGHTVGHAIERSKGILHGEAVGMGMVFASRLSRSLGLLSSPELDRVEKLVLAAGLPVSMELNPDEIYQNIRKDKKKRGEEVHFVLLKGLGSTLVRTIALTELIPMIRDLC